jgi:ribonucleotide monophosphatase NagD (HAD superfamily)
MIMLTKTGTSFGAGAIAKEYEKLGGNLSWFGKPYGEIYNFARKFIPEILPQKVLCIGDSPEHDIRGGYFANCKTALVRSGIHSKSSFQELVEGLADSDRADFVIPNFSFV